MFKKMFIFMLLCSASKELASPSEPNTPRTPTDKGKQRAPSTPCRTPENQTITTQGTPRTPERNPRLFFPETPEGHYYAGGPSSSGEELRTPTNQKTNQIIPKAPKYLKSHQGTSTSKYPLNPQASPHLAQALQFTSQPSEWKKEAAWKKYLALCMPHLQQWYPSEEALQKQINKLKIMFYEQESSTPPTPSSQGLSSAPQSPVTPRRLFSFTPSSIPSTPSTQTSSARTTPSARTPLNTQITPQTNDVPNEDQEEPAARVLGQVARRLLNN